MVDVVSIVSHIYIEIKKLSLKIMLKDLPLF